MDIFELKKQRQLDEVKAMVDYALSVNSDTDSDEYKTALWYWVHNLLDDYRKAWKPHLGGNNGE